MSVDAIHCEYHSILTPKAKFCLVISGEISRGWQTSESEFRWRKSGTLTDKEIVLTEKGAELTQATDVIYGKLDQMLEN